MNGVRSYRVTELLGRGAFGSVYLADTVGTGIERTVAIKVLRPEQAAIPGLLERLRDEARMLSMIRHRAIVRVDDLVELDGHWSVVMEYIEGCDVATLVKDGPLPPRVALAIAEEIANALHVAATQPGPDGRPIRLVHRDVKPGNIRVTAQGEVKLLDFGVARADFSAREAGATTAVYGTPTYMAPERFRGEDTFAGDVYALGVTLFEMLAGEPPGQSPMELERVPPGIKLAGAWRQIRETSLPLRDLICAMLAHAPGERPSARDCARSFARIRGQLGGMILEDWAERVVPPAMRARKKGEGGGRVGTVMLERPSEASLRMQGPPKPRTAMWAAMGTVALLGVGVLGAGVLGVGAWWMWGGGTGTTPTSTEPGSPTTSAATGAEGAPVAVGAPSGAQDPTGSVPVPVPVGAPAPVGESAPVAAPGAAVAATPGNDGSTTIPATTQATTPPTALPTTLPTTPPTASSRPTGSSAPTLTPATPSTPSRPDRPGTVSGGRGLQGTGIVALDGQASGLVLTGRAGVFGVGEVAVGDYTADVTLLNGETVQIRDVTVNPARVTKISCDASACREMEEW
ncbi:MAG: serine/threonine-protein kinase [Pseudomonadota bacterium]|nr:serine/threonine-protein kinase [Pseudomonadota bacterium]